MRHTQRQMKMIKYQSALGFDLDKIDGYDDGEGPVGNLEY